MDKTWCDLRAALLVVVAKSQECRSHQVSSISRTWCEFLSVSSISLSLSLSLSLFPSSLRVSSFKVVWEGGMR